MAIGLATPLASQEPVHTAGGNGAELEPRRRSSEHGFYVGASGRVSRVARQTATLTGAEIAWVGDHRFTAGIAGYAHVGGALTNPHAPPARRAAPLDYGYGGVAVGYGHPVGARLTLGGQLLAGGGGVNYRRARGVESENGRRHVFVLAEPTLRLQYAPMRYTRVGLDVAYRLTTRPKVDGIGGRDVGGASVGIAAQLGRFGVAVASSGTPSGAAGPTRRRAAPSGGRAPCARPRTTRVAPSSGSRDRAVMSVECGGAWPRRRPEVCRRGGPAALERSVRRAWPLP